MDGAHRRFPRQVTWTGNGDAVRQRIRPEVAASGHPDCCMLPQRFAQGVQSRREAWAVTAAFREAVGTSGVDSTGG